MKVKAAFPLDQEVSTLLLLRGVDGSRVVPSLHASLLDRKSVV